VEYQADEEVARLIARSDELSEQSRAVNERGARSSSALGRLLVRCVEVCDESDRVYGRQHREAATERGAWDKSLTVSLSPLRRV
jgi:hypothetical protein